MRNQSFRQAFDCETAKGSRCKCRCKGAYHGVKRLPEAWHATEARDLNPDDRSRVRYFFERLDEDDPHRLPNRDEVLERRAELRAQRRREKVERAWREKLAAWSGLVTRETEPWVHTSINELPIFAAG